MRPGAAGDWPPVVLGVPVETWPGIRLVSFAFADLFRPSPFLVPGAFPLRAQALLDHIIKAVLFEAVLQPFLFLPLASPAMRIMLDAVWRPVVTGCCSAATGHV